MYSIHGMVFLTDPHRVPCKELLFTSKNQHTSVARHTMLKIFTASILWQEKEFITPQLKHSDVSEYSLQTTYLEHCCVFVGRAHRR
jgi:hypothetical protein